MLLLYQTYLKLNIFNDKKRMKDFIHQIIILLIVMTLQIVLKYIKLKNILNVLM